MKRIYCILAAIFSLVMASCNKAEGDGATAVDGEWYTSMTVDDEIVLDVFIAFEKGEFTMYQRSGTQTRFFIYKGTFTLVDGVLSGNYVSEKTGTTTPWGAQYKVTVDGNAMLMESMNESHEVNYYTMVTIPEDVKKNAVPTLESRALSEENEGVL